jgi:hypothetical protein
MARAVLLTIALVLLTSASARASGDIYTLAGGGTAAPRDGMPAARANLQSELGVAALPDGGFLVDVTTGSGASIRRASCTTSPATGGAATPATAARPPRPRWRSPISSRLPPAGS